MKLKEWSEKTGVKYLTAYRWFKDGKFPCPIYQTESGTIIVNDESLENQTVQQPNNDVVSDFLKNVVEFSKNESSIEDFAAFILSNYIIKSKSSIDNQSKIKPSKEEIQKHYQQFIPQKVKPPVNIFIADKNTFDSCDSIKDVSDENDYIEDKIQEVLDLLRLDDSKLDEEKIKLLEALKSYNKPPASEKSNIITTINSSTLK